MKEYTFLKMASLIYRKINMSEVSQMQKLLHGPLKSLTGLMSIKDIQNGCVLALQCDNQNAP